MYEYHINDMMVAITDNLAKAGYDFEPHSRLCGQIRAAIENYWIDKRAIVYSIEDVESWMDDYPSDYLTYQEKVDILDNFVDNDYLSEMMNERLQEMVQDAMDKGEE